MNIPVKSRQMIDYIMEKIVSGEFTAGKRIPPIRDLMKLFDLSNGAVKRGIDYLAEKGYLELKQGSGVYVKKRNNRGEKNKIAVFFADCQRGFKNGLYPSIFLGMQEPARLEKSSLVVNYLSIEDATFEKISETANGADGIILLSEYDAYIKTFPFNIPVVGVMIHCQNGTNMSIVDIDPFSSADIAVEYFKSLKITEVVLITFNCPNYIIRGKVFASQWKELGGTVSFIEAGKDIKFDKEKGYLFDNGSTLQEYSQKYFLKNGKFLSDNHTILGIEGKNLIAPSFHKTPSIALDWQLIGIYAFEECIYRIKHPATPPRRIYVKGYFHKG